jgi:predicted ABC-type ATPase
MPKRRPVAVALAGPNGAGKSTAGPHLIRDLLGVTRFVDADVIARGISAFAPEEAAVAAGRVMLGRLRELARHRQSFAFETTLAARSYGPWIARLKKGGYTFHVIFLWLPSAEFAIQRVRDRVRLGGHAVPEETVRRRYRAGLLNFFVIYRPLASSWHFFDNSVGLDPVLVASGRGTKVTSVGALNVWNRVRRVYETKSPRKGR